MKVIRLEEMVGLDVYDVRHELTKVRTEKKRLDAYENDLEDQLGKLMRDEANLKAIPINLDPGPRDKFIDDTKDMHLSEAERELKVG